MLSMTNAMVLSFIPTICADDDQCTRCIQLLMSWNNALSDCIFVHHKDEYVYYNAVYEVSEKAYYKHLDAQMPFLLYYMPFCI